MVDFILYYMEEPHEMVDHEVCCILYVLEENRDELDEIQAHINCKRKTELPHGVSPLSIEESEEILSVGPSLDGVDASTCLVDNCFKD